MIIFYFIKHFKFDLYQTICPVEPLEEQFKITYKNDEMTLETFMRLGNAKTTEFSSEETSDFEKDADKSNKIGEKQKEAPFFVLNEGELIDTYNNPKNKEKILILLMLGYEFVVRQYGNSLNDFPTSDYETTSVMANREHNDKINRIIWNLMSGSTSIYTEHEHIVNIFTNSVLNAPLNSVEERKIAFENFIQELENVKDKKNVDKAKNVAGNEWRSVFQAFSVEVPGNEREIWLKLIKFFFDYVGQNGITRELVGALNYCNISKRTVYMNVLKIFSELKVVENLSREPRYRQFLKKFIGSLIDFGYVKNGNLASKIHSLSDTSLLWKGKFPFEIFDMIVKDLEDTLKSISQLQRFKDDAEIIKKFLNKNSEIISYGVERHGFNDDFDLNVKIVEKNQEEINKITDLIKDPNSTNEEFKKALLSGYENENLSFADVYQLEHEWMNSRVKVISPEVFKKTFTQSK